MTRVDDINAILDNLGAGGTYEQFEYALRDYGQRELISVLADRAAAGGGGAAPDPDKWVMYSGDPVAIDDGVQGYLTWDTYGDGDPDLLDLTDPGAPEVVEAGWYAVTINASGQVLTEDGYFELTAEMDSQNHDATAVNQSRKAGVGGGAPSPTTCATLMFYLPAGADIRGKIGNRDGAATRNFFLQEGLVVKFA